MRTQDSSNFQDHVDGSAAGWELRCDAVPVPQALCVHLEIVLFEILNAARMQLKREELSMAAIHIGLTSSWPLCRYGGYGGYGGATYGGYGGYGGATLGSYSGAWFSPGSGTQVWRGLSSL